MAKKLTDLVTWVGKTDWQLTRFHGDELSTDHGSSYNSYLIRDDKTVLIDTVWQPYDREFVSRLKEVVDLSAIDAIVMNHNEIDHSGALPELLREIPGTPIYCTCKGKEILRGHYHEDWNFVTVHTGDTLSTDSHTLTFIEAPMLHWPDTMVSYFDGDGGILFSNDVFGQHFATESIFDDTENLSDLMYEALKYYANIVSPYSPMAARKLKEILGMNLPMRLIAPSHGVVWRSHVADIIESYRQWSANYQENRITLIYDTMWNSTRRMAESIAEGIEQADPEVKVCLFNAAKQDKNDILTEMFRSKAVLVGSPTINNGVSFAIAGLLEMAKGLKLRNKKGGAFGSYGWSGESVKILCEELKKVGFDVEDNGIRVTWVPDDDALEQCRDYGRKFATAVKTPQQ